MEAESIFHNHLTANAPLPVNIDSCAVRDAEEQLQNPNNDMFRLQQQQVRGDLLSCRLNWYEQLFKTFGDGSTQNWPAQLLWIEVNRNIATNLEWD